LEILKFFGHGILWDNENNKVLLEFVNGEVETKDEKLIKLLKENGYKHQEEKVTKKVDKVK
jgi:hypothetical protein